MQVEYSTDLIFRSEAILGPLYEQLSRQAVLAVKAEQVASFLVKKISPQLPQEIGCRFATRIEGTCIKHRLGKTGVKMYDKFARVLRLETTTNDVAFFTHHRKVEHQDGHATRELAPLRKSIYCQIDLREILAGCNRRYLEFLSALEDTSRGERDLARLTEPQREGERAIKGLNFFQRTEQALLRALQRPEFKLHGLRRADVKPFVPLSDSALSRQSHRLRTLGLIKRVTRSYRYYDKSLRPLTEASGFDVGVGPSVVVVDEGMGKTLTTVTAKQNVCAFVFGQRGLLGGIGEQGNKITKVSNLRLTAILRGCVDGMTSLKFAAACRR